jgi:hypothetical protein
MNTTPLFTRRADGTFEFLGYVRAADRMLETGSVLFTAADLYKIITSATNALNTMPTNVEDNTY